MIVNVPLQIVVAFLFSVCFKASAGHERRHVTVGKDSVGLGGVLLRGGRLLQDRRVLQVLRGLQREAETGNNDAYHIL